MLFRMDLVEVIGKQSRKVPMLIPPDVKQALELLVSRRTDAGIPLDNPFVFAKVCVTQIICFWYHACRYCVYSLCSPVPNLTFIGAEMWEYRP